MKQGVAIIVLGMLMVLQGVGETNTPLEKKSVRARKPRPPVVAAAVESKTNTPPPSVAGSQKPAAPTFTRKQVEHRLKMLENLRERGLLEQSFYERKVKECEQGLKE